MILVTGATGNIGRELLRQLHQEPVGPVRALTRDTTRIAPSAGVEVVEGDLARADTLKSALDGVRSLFLPSGIGATVDVLSAAQQAGVAQVVLVSSITVQTHPHLCAAADHRAVEELLRESGLGWTILRPTQFAANTLGWAASIREHGVVRGPYPDIGLPTIHPADIAAVARVSLTGPAHRGQTYALTGPALITPRQQAAAIGVALGRQVPFVEISRAQAHREMAPFLGAETAGAVLDLMGGDVNDELLRVHDTVSRVTGRPGRSFLSWAQENVAAFR